MLTPTGRSPVSGPILKFGQAIVDAIFVQKISNFWWVCSLVLASRCTNFYNILIFGLKVMPQKQNPCELRAARAGQKTFYFLTFLSWIFFNKFLTKFLKISSTWKVLRHTEFTREMLKNQLHCFKSFFNTHLTYVQIKVQKSMHDLGRLTRRAAKIWSIFRFWDFSYFRS
jgi:hypothetical protein